MMDLHRLAVMVSKRVVSTHSLKRDEKQAALKAA